MERFGFSRLTGLVFSVQNVWKGDKPEGKAPPLRLTTHRSKAEDSSTAGAQTTIGCSLQRSLSPRAYEPEAPSTPQ